VEASTLVFVPISAAETAPPAVCALWLLPVLSVAAPTVVIRPDVVRAFADNPSPESTVPEEPENLSPEMALPALPVVPGRPLDVWTLLFCPVGCGLAAAARTCAAVLSVAEEES
jgi:hypothetical protein